MRFGAGVVEAHVVRCPSSPERFAADREFADESGESAIVGIGAGGATHDRDGLVGDALPVGVHLPGARVQKEVAGRVHRPVDVGV